MKQGMFFVLALLATVIPACGGLNAPVYETVVPAEIQPGNAVPAPTNEVVLTLSGNITASNSDGLLELDLPTLEKFGLVQYTVTDPWFQDDVTYTGILLADLIEVAAPPDPVTAVTVTALDGYSADIPLAEIQRWPVLLATRANDQHLTIANNGPTRIIFPYDAHQDVTAARNMSVWNIEFLEIK
jgi:hypothetical protein